MSATAPVARHAATEFIGILHSPSVVRRRRASMYVETDVRRGCRRAKEFTVLVPCPPVPVSRHCPGDVLAATDGKFRVARARPKQPRSTRRCKIARAANRRATLLDARA